MQNHDDGNDDRNIMLEEYRYWSVAIVDGSNKVLAHKLPVCFRIKRPRLAEFVSFKCLSYLMRESKSEYKYCNVGIERLFMGPCSSPKTLSKRCKRFYSPIPYRNRRDTHGMV
jgi:hypothetical protein